MNKPDSETSTNSVRGRAKPNPVSGLESMVEQVGNELEVGMTEEGDDADDDDGGEPEQEDV